MVEEQEEHVDRVACKQEKDHRVEHQKEALYRVHGQAGPGACVDVLVMPGVKPGVELAHMQQAVQPVEVQTRPNGDQNDHGEEPNGVVFKRDHARPAIGIGVPHKCLPEDREGERGSQCPEHIVPDLVFKMEDL